MPVWQQLRNPNYHGLVASQLSDALRVEEIAQSYEERRLLENSQALNDGDWIDLVKAASLASFCKKIEDKYNRIRTAVRRPDRLRPTIALEIHAA